MEGKKNNHMVFKLYTACVLFDDFQSASSASRIFFKMHCGHERKA
jgi:hypothetical protein